MKSILALLLAGALAGGELTNGRFWFDPPLVGGGVVTACNDGIDNDGDGAIDYAGGSGDIECSDITDNSELWEPPGMVPGSDLTIASDLGADVQVGKGPVRTVHYDLVNAVATTARLAGGYTDAEKVEDVRDLFCYLSFGSSMGSDPLPWGPGIMPANKWWGPCSTIASHHIAEVNQGNSLDDVYLVVANTATGNYQQTTLLELVTTDVMNAHLDSERVCVSSDGSFPDCPIQVTKRETYAHATISGAGDLDEACDGEFVTDGETLVLVEVGRWSVSTDCNDVDDDHAIVGLGGSAWDMRDVANRITIEGTSGSITVFRGTNASGGADRIRIDNFAIASEEHTIAGSAQRHAATSMQFANDLPVVSRVHGLGINSIGSASIDATGNHSTRPSWVLTSYQEPNCSTAGETFGSVGMWNDSTQRFVVIGFRGNRACSLTFSNIASPATVAQEEHCFRCQDPDEAVMRGVECGDQGNGRHAWAMRGDQHHPTSDGPGTGPTGDGIASQSLWWTLTEFRLGSYNDTTGSGAPVLQVGPQHGNVGGKGELEELGNGLIWAGIIFIEASDATMQQPTLLSTFGVTIRGLVIKWGKTTNPPSGDQYLYFDKRGPNPINVDITNNEVAHVTIQTEDTTPGNMVRFDNCGASADNVVVNSIQASASDATFSVDDDDTCIGTEAGNVVVADAALRSVADTDFRDYMLCEDRFDSGGPAQTSCAVGDPPCGDGFCDADGTTALPTATVYRGAFDIDAKPYTNAPGVNQP